MHVKACGIMHELRLKAHRALLNSVLNKFTEYYCLQSNVFSCGPVVVNPLMHLKILIAYRRVSTANISKNFSLELNLKAVAVS